MDELVGRALVNRYRIDAFIGGGAMADGTSPAWQPRPSGVTVGRPQGRIAFASMPERSLYIFVMKGEGTQVVNVTHSPGIGEHDRAWSAHGQWIGPGGADGEIHIIGPDGPEETIITKYA